MNALPVCSFWLCRCKSSRILINVQYNDSVKRLINGLPRKCDMTLLCSHELFSSFPCQSLNRDSSSYNASITSKTTHNLRIRFKLGLQHISVGFFKVFTLVLNQTGILSQLVILETEMSHVIIVINICFVKNGLVENVRSGSQGTRSVENTGSGGKQCGENTAYHFFFTKI